MTAAGPAGGVRLGRVLGVPVYVAPSWLLFAAVVVLFYGPVLADSLGPVQGYAAAASFAVLLLSSVLLHEVGHCVVARAFDLPVRSITVTFLAGLTEITESPQTPAREYAVAVVGPMVSLLLAGVGAGLLPLFEPGSLLYLLAAGLAVTNGLVAAFNLLPGLPLDGGRVLRAVVWRATGDPLRSTVVAAHAGRAVAVAVPVAVLAEPLLLGRGTPSLFTAVVTGLVAAFVFAGATASLRSAQVVRRLPPGTAGQLARPALAVPAGLPLSEAVRLVHEAGRHALVIVDGDGRTQAVVSEAAVVAVPEHRRPWVTVGEVARRVDADRALDPALGGEALLHTLRAAAVAEHLVRPPAGEPPRVLLTADVARRADGRSPAASLSGP